MSKFITGEQFNEGVKQVASYLNDKINDVANAPKQEEHNHKNKDVLDKISINESGKLLYNGATVGLKGDKGNTGATGADGKNIELKAGEDDNCIYWRHEGSEGDMGWELLFDMTELLSSVHKHSNKDVIDLISKDEAGNLLFNGNLISGVWEDIKGRPELIEKVELIEDEIVFTFTDLSEKRITIHSHNNKEILDKISESEEGNLLFNNKLVDGHTHNNKDVLDKISQDDNGKFLYDGKEVTSDTSDIEKAIEKNTNSINSLKIRSHAGETLDYGQFKMSETLSFSTDTYVPFNTIQEKNGIELDTSTGFISLKANRVYELTANVRLIFSSSAGKADVSWKNTKTGEQIGTHVHIKPVTSTESSITAGCVSCIIKPSEDISVGVHVYNSTYLSLISLASNCVIKEIGRTYMHNEVQSVDLKDGIQDAPVGHVINQIGNNIPKHYLKCDGSEYNIVDYPKLAEYFLNELGRYNYFGGDGVTTFAVPNINNENINVIDHVPNLTSNTSNSSVKITSSGCYSESYEYYLFDGNTSTGWFSNLNPTVANHAWIQCQFLDGAKKINTVKLRNHLMNGANRCKDFILQGSNDGIAYDDLISDTLPDDASNYYVFDINATKTYSYIKVKVLSTYGATNYNYGLGDLKIQFTIPSTKCIKYEPTYYMEYHPKYATFKEETLFNGEINTTGEYTLSNNVNDYDYIYMETIKYNYIDVIPAMTSNNSPAPYVITTSSIYSNAYSGYNAFDKKKSTTSSNDVWASASGTSSAWIKIDCGTPKASYMCEITSRLISQNKDTGIPNSIIISGSNDDSIYDVLHDSGTLSWNLGETKSFVFEKNVSYRYYKFEFTTNGYNCICINEISLLERLSIENPVFVKGKNCTLQNQDLSLSFNDKIIKIDNISNSIANIIGIKGSADKIVDAPSNNNCICESMTEEEFNVMIDNIMEVIE